MARAPPLPLGTVRAVSLPATCTYVRTIPPYCLVVATTIFSEKKKKTSFELNYIIYNLSEEMHACLLHFT